MVVDHIGYAVKNIEKAILSFGQLGYVFEEIIEDKDRNIYIAFGELSGYRVELVAPINKEGSPVDIYLKKNGAIPYHICYKSNALEQDIQYLIEKGYKVIIEETPAIAFHGKKVIFLIHPNIGILEIVEDF